MRPYILYVWDFFFYGIYIFFSFCLCWGIFFYNIDTLFLFEVLPVLHTLFQKRFIATQLTHLFNTTWFLCTSLSFIFIFPLLAYSINLFFMSSWYMYQIRFYKTLIIILIKVFSVIYYFCQLFLLPYIVTFFLFWEVLNDYSLLKIEAEISLFFYIKWIFTLKVCISLCISLFFYLIIFLVYVYNNKSLYNLIQNQKKKLWFILVCISLLFIPPDLLIQLILTSIIFLLVECFFLFICLKLFFSSKKIIF